MNVVLLGEVCHCIPPLLPVKVRVVELPEQMIGFAAVATPATEIGLTLTLAIVDKSEVQPTLVTTAL